MKIAGLLFTFLVAASNIAAQPLESGDVVVSTGFLPSRVLVYRNDGTFKRELASRDGSFFRETLFHRGLLYAPRDSFVEVFDRNGVPVPGFGAPALLHLAPAADGSILASNGSGELFRYGPDGTLLWRRNTVMLFEPPAVGIDLASDQCSLFATVGNTVVSWDVCRDTSWQRVAPHLPFSTGTALRLLSDGSFLMAHRTDVILFDSSGAIVRTYGIPGVSLAVDIDRTSFWVGAGGSLLKVDIQTGTILLNVPVGEPVRFLSIVDEPRAALQTSVIPTLHPAMLALLGVVIAVIAFRRMTG